MVIRSADGMTRSTARPAGINGKMRLDKEIRQLQQISQMGSLPHRRQTSHKVRENPKLAEDHRGALDALLNVLRRACDGAAHRSDGSVERLLRRRVVGTHAAFFPS